jgi:hypothetical protein
VLAALILFEILRAGYRANPFARLRLPPVPTLQTNNMITATNIFAAAAATNTVVKTNPAVATPISPSGLTNKVASGSTNVLAVTNTVAVGSNNIISSTNKAAAAGTNAIALTNRIVACLTNLLQATNRVGAASTNAGATNIAHSANPNSVPPDGHGAGMPVAGGMPGMPGMGAVALPKEIQARVDKIVDSEMFAPVMRPLPMQLFGIAGDTALLRTDGGQSGLVKEGDSLGGVKLMRIGINRVLVEQNGNLKELMIFDGYGGESLMPKTNTISK